MPEMTTQITESHVEFYVNKTLIAAYVLNDTFKPYFSELKSPDGHTVQLVSPGDHRHHKGLMYGLKTDELNFWEEEPHLVGCGVQRVISTELLEGKTGFVQEILWEHVDGGLETYQEKREISLSFDEAHGAFLWDWKTQRLALRDHELVMSPHSMKLEDGRKINYHGLGVRLPWMWNFVNFPKKQFCGIEMTGEASSMEEACGTNVSSVGFWGAIDGNWETKLASLTLSQPAEQAFSWFVLKGPFAYLSVGPSNDGPVSIRKGQACKEAYQIQVADRGVLAYS